MTISQGRANSQASQVKAAALAVGFDAVAICDLQAIQHTALPDWLARGYGGSMRYMHRQMERRQNPATIVPGTRRAVVLLKNYHQPPTAERPGRARVASYACGEDYHRVLGEWLAHLADVLIGLGSSAEHTRWYVDAGPVPERELAQRAGLGWIAKNTMLIHPGMGSFTFIGSIFTNLALQVDPPFPSDRCGRCRRCLDACPTRAFPQERVLDATRCISYLTIEHRGPFNADQGSMIGEWLFGCDVCQEVCPWNVKFAVPNNEPRFASRPALAQPDLATLSTLAEPAFRVLCGDTALDRAEVGGITRNARQVSANLRDRR